MTRDELASHLAALASHFPGWSAELLHDHYGTLTRPDGLAIGFRVGQYGQYLGRVEVKPHLPRCNGQTWSLHYYGALKHDEAAPRMSYDASRPPAKVAREIARKVAEPYSALFPKVMAKKASVEGAQMGAFDTARTLAGILEDGDPFASKRYSGGQCLYVGGYGRPGNAHFTVHEYNRVDVRLSSLEPYQAEALARWLQQECPRPQKEAAE